ncbi:MAG: tetratricopeptide repeat protein [Candidatus Berkelbacteria bacterium]|nr:tetratricopeptide repeat protein [Candidatus Berkelbacteria bacterium]
MIIYPVIILTLLIVGFVIIWRRAYILEREGKIEVEDESKKIKDEKRSWFSFAKKSHEPEAEVDKEKDEDFIKAEELFSKKQYISAEKWYLEVIKKDPKNSKVYSRLGTIYLEQRNFQDAKEAFEEAIRLDDRVASRFFNLSYVYNALGDLRGASNYAKRAIRLDPDNAKYRRWLDELRRGRV